MSTAYNWARQPINLTVFRIAWAFALAISTAANVKFCQSLAYDASLDNYLWTGAGLMVELAIASLPLIIRSNLREKNFLVAIPASLICAIAACASLYAGLSFASMVREDAVASAKELIQLKRKVSELELKPTPAMIQPQIDLLMSDRRLGQCKVVRSKYGREKCKELARLRVELASAENNRRLLRNTLLRIKIIPRVTTHASKHSESTDAGSAYVVRLLNSVTKTSVEEKDVRLIATTGLVVMIWLLVLFGGLIAFPARMEPENKAVKNTAPEPQNDDKDGPTAASKADKEPAKVVPLVRRGRKSKSAAAVQRAIAKAGGQLIGSKSEIARQLKISRTSLDTAISNIVESGEAIANWDGQQLRLASA